MKHFCDGTDPESLMWVSREGARVYDYLAGTAQVPCDCGCTYDDLVRETVWPHWRLEDAPPPRGIETIETDLL